MMTVAIENAALFPPHDEDGVSRQPVKAPRPAKPLGLPLVLIAGGVTGAVIWPLLADYLPHAHVVSMMAPGGWLRVLIAVSVGLVSFVLSIWLHIVIHELGHLGFGVACGMRPLAIGIGPLRLVRFAHGWRRCPPAHIAGIGGFAILLPKPDDVFRTGSMVAFVLGGAMMNLLSAIAGIVLLRQLPQAPVEARIAIVVFIICGVLSGLGNLIPRLSHGWMTDGRWLLEMLRGTEQSRIIRDTMRNAAGSIAGTRPAARSSVLTSDARPALTPTVALAALEQDLFRALDCDDRATAQALARELRTLYPELSTFHRTSAALSLAAYAAVAEPSPELLGAWVEHSKGDTLLPRDGLRAWLAAELAVRECDQVRAHAAIIHARESLDIEGDPGVAAFIKERLSRLQAQWLESPQSHSSY
jgi:hypothetical protein